MTLQGDYTMNRKPHNIFIYEAHKIPAGELVRYRTVLGLVYPKDTLRHSGPLAYIRSTIETGSSMTIHIYYNQPRDYWYLQVEDRTATCNITGEPFPWSGRKWILSDKMTAGEVVQTAFMALLAAEEHELRERFKYAGQAIFDPHYDIDKLVWLRGQEGALKERDHG